MYVSRSGRGRKKTSWIYLTDVVNIIFVRKIASRHFDTSFESDLPSSFNQKEKYYSREMSKKHVLKSVYRKIYTRTHGATHVRYDLQG